MPTSAAFKCPRRWPAARWLLACLLLGVIAPTTARATSYARYRQIGVAGPLFIDGERVIFIQADGTLTMLDLATGDVLARVDAPGGIHPSRIEVVGDDLLVATAYSGVWVFDRADAALRWHRNTGQPPLRFDDVIVHGDGWGGVYGLDLATGRELWRFHEPHAYNYLRSGDDLFIFRATSYYDGDCLLVRLDPATGKERWRVLSEPGVQWLGVGVGEKTIYAPAGPLDKPGHFIPLAEDMPRPAKECDRILRWDRDGNPLAPLPAPEMERPWTRYLPENFTIEGETFSAYPPRPTGDMAFDTLAKVLKAPPPDAELAAWLELSPGEAAHPGGIAMSHQWLDFKPLFYHDGSWLRFVEHPAGKDGRDRWRTVIFAGGDGVRWRGTAAYLSLPANGPAEAAFTDREILIGTTLGQVECLDRATGVSRWLYHFPVRRRQQPPSLFDSRRGRVYLGRPAEYRRDPADPQFLGTQIDGRPPRPTRVIFDPRPWHVTYPLFTHVFSWILAVGGLLGMAGVAINHHRGDGTKLVKTPVQWRRWPDRAAGESFTDAAGWFWRPCRWSAMRRWRWFRREPRKERKARDPADVAFAGLALTVFLLYAYLLCGRPPIPAGAALRLAAAAIFLAGLAYVPCVWRKSGKEEKGKAVVLAAVFIILALLALPLYLQWP